MAVIDTTDTQLLVETAENDCVVLKYHTDDCGKPCNDLVPIYENFSNKNKYNDFVFLRINADNNPVAKNFIINKLAPIVTIYFKGRLIESRSVRTEQEIEELLEKLRFTKLNNTYE